MADKYKDVRDMTPKEKLQIIGKYKIATSEGKFTPGNFTRWLLDKSGNHFVTIKGFKGDHGILYYKDGIYHKLGSYEIDQIAEILMRPIRGLIPFHRTQIKGSISAETYCDESIFDINPNIIHINNGILNIKTKEIIPHDPKCYSMSKFDLTYDPTAKCPNFETFINRILPDKEERDTMIEIMGYCLYRDYPFHKFFILTGSGFNGKGVYQGVLSRFIGDSNIASIAIHQLTQQFSGAGKLRYKCANIVGEIRNTEVKFTERIKQLTGEDMIESDVKYGDNIRFYNYAKLIYATNEMPMFNDKSVGFWERFVAIDFNQTIPEIERTDKLELLALLTTEKELSGILNLALDGLARLFKNKHFSCDVDGIDVKRMKYGKEGMNTVERFLSNNTKEESNIECKYLNKDFYNEYNLWCKLPERNIKQKDIFPTTRTFNREVKKFYKDSDVVKQIDNAKGIDSKGKGWQGIDVIYKQAEFEWDDSVDEEW